MIKLNQLFKAIQVLRHSEYLGDFAVLKAEGLGAKINPAVESRMQSVLGYHPAVDLGNLSRLPPGTFGHEYANHMKANHLKPFNLSPGLSEVAKRNVFALRYAVTHDIFHVLLGFDTSYAGEIGVLAFAAAQNYSKSLKISLTMAMLLYPILAPRQSKRIFTNARQGTTLGKKAGFLLGYRFEDNWQRPLVAVKAELGLV